MVDNYAIPPIARGYPYSVFVKAISEDVNGPAAFPAGCVLLAKVANVAGGTAVALLQTEDGSIERISDDTIKLIFSDADTTRLTNLSAVLDIVRTDPTTVWLGLTVELAVHRPITAARRI